MLYNIYMKFSIKLILFFLIAFSNLIGQSLEEEMMIDTSDINREIQRTRIATNVIKNSFRIGNDFDKKNTIKWYGKREANQYKWDEISKGYAQYLLSNIRRNLTLSNIRILNRSIYSKSDLNLFYQKEINSNSCACSVFEKTSYGYYPSNIFIDNPKSFFDEITHFFYFDDIFQSRYGYGEDELREVGFSLFDEEKKDIIIQKSGIFKDGKNEVNYLNLNFNNQKGNKIFTIDFDDISGDKFSFDLNDFFRINLNFDMPYRGDDRIKLPVTFGSNDILKENDYRNSINWLKEFEKYLFYEEEISKKVGELIYSKNSYFKINIGNDNDMYDFYNPGGIKRKIDISKSNKINDNSLEIIVEKKQFFNFYSSKDRETVPFYYLTNLSYKQFEEKLITVGGVYAGYNNRILENDVLYTIRIINTASGIELANKEIYIVDEFEELSITNLKDNLFITIDNKLVFETDYAKFEYNLLSFTPNKFNKRFRISDRYTYNEDQEPPIFVDNLEIEQPFNLIIDETTTSASDWTSSGTGLILTQNGHIVTNYHVIENAEDIEIEVTINDKIEKFEGKIILSDEKNDLAILKINDQNFKVEDINFNVSKNILDVGSEVFSLGYPLVNIMGSEIKFTDGRISSKSGYKGDITTYQTTVPIQPGNSGGPLFDYDGNLIGINSSGLSREITENVSYSIKSKYLINLFDEIENFSQPIRTSNISVSQTDLIKELSKYVVLIKVK